MKIIFIRHGKTNGNLTKKYIGKTDEPLCDEGILMLKEKDFPECDIVFSSPMKRCLQTAEIIYPDKKIIICNGLSECDFGDFEGKNYSELSDNPDYQKWIDSGGMATFPNGENPENFKKRCVNAFEKSISSCDNMQTTAFVVHGGTIMSVMEKYAIPQRDYYDYSIENACGYVADFDGKSLRIMEKI